MILMNQFFRAWNCGHLAEAVFLVPAAVRLPEELLEARIVHGAPPASGWFTYVHRCREASQFPRGLGATTNIR